MPLNWMMAGVMMLIVMFCASFIYSEVMGSKMISMQSYKVDENLNIWCW